MFFTLSQVVKTHYSTVYNLIDEQAVDPKEQTWNYLLLHCIKVQAAHEAGIENRLRD